MRNNDYPYIRAFHILMAGAITDQELERMLREARATGAPDDAIAGPKPISGEASWWLRLSAEPWLTLSAIERMIGTGSFEQEWALVFGEYKAGEGTQVGARMIKMAVFWQDAIPRLKEIVASQFTETRNRRAQRSGR